MYRGVFISGHGYLALASVASVVPFLLWHDYLLPASVVPCLLLLRTFLFGVTHRAKLQLAEYLYLGPIQMDQLGNLHSVKSMPKLIRVRDTLGMSRLSPQPLAKENVSAPPEFAG
jgi:hypothetical protein